MKSFRTLFRWSLHKSWIGIMAFLFGIGAFEALQPVAIRTFGNLDTLVGLLPLIPSEFLALMSVTPDFLAGSGLAGFLSLGFDHPVYLLLCSALIIWFSARGLAGEMESGSIQIALSRPVSRRTLYAALFVSTALVMALASLAGATGMQIGLWLAKPDGTFQSSHFIALMGLTFSLFFAIAGVTLGVSAASDRLSQAIGITAAFLLISFVVNYFARLWSLMEPLDRLSIFHYYRPAGPMTQGTLEWGDVAVLLGVGLIGLLAGAWKFERRDLPN